MVGLSDPLIWRRLTPYGFDEDELGTGMSLLNGLTSVRLAIKPGFDPKQLAAIDQWENHWFPIVEVVLRTNYPAVHDVVFRNLTQTEGVDVVVSVRTLLDRIDEVCKPESDGGLPKGADARALLNKRGFTAEVEQKGRESPAKVGTVPEAADVLAPVEPEKVSAAEDRMWNWYLEWSGIARTVIHDRRSLRELGFLRPVRRPDGTVEDVVVDDAGLQAGGASDAANGGNGVTTANVAGGGDAAGGNPANSGDAPTGADLVGPGGPGSNS